MVSRGYFTKRAMIITERKETAATYILTTSDKVSYKITNNLFNMKSKLTFYNVTLATGTGQLSAHVLLILTRWV